MRGRMAREISFFFLSAREQPHGGFLIFVLARGRFLGLRGTREFCLLDVLAGG